LGRQLLIPPGGLLVFDQGKGKIRLLSHHWALSFTHHFTFGPKPVANLRKKNQITKLLDFQVVLLSGDSWK
jgi:hypothetical protein